MTPFVIQSPSDRLLAEQHARAQILNATRFLRGMTGWRRWRFGAQRDIATACRAIDIANGALSVFAMGFDVIGVAGRVADDVALQLDGLSEPRNEPGFFAPLHVMVRHLRDVADRQDLGPLPGNVTLFPTRRTG